MSVFAISSTRTTNDLVPVKESYLFSKNMDTSKQEALLGDWLGVASEIKYLLAYEIPDKLFRCSGKTGELIERANSLDKKLSDLSDLAPGLFNEKMVQEFNYRVTNHKSYCRFISLIHELENVCPNDWRGKTGILEISSSLLNDVIDKEKDMLEVLQFSIEKTRSL